MGAESKRAERDSTVRKFADRFEADVEVEDLGQRSFDFDAAGYVGRTSEPKPGDFVNVHGLVITDDDIGL